MRITYIILIFSMAIVTYITRASFLIFFTNKRIPNTLQRFLKYIPISILAALIFPSIFAPQGKLYLSISNPYIGASFITIASILFTKKYTLSIILGIVSLILLKNYI